jgi:hypothetical protein
MIIQSMSIEALAAVSLVVAVVIWFLVATRNVRK